MTVSTESARDTKDRILDAAEQLFGSQGFAATSLRQITAAADVNLAAVNYHFQTKDLLVEAVVRRKLGPINARRMDLMDALESQMPEVVPSLEEVLKAFVQPVLDASLIGIELGAFPLLMGRLLSTPDDWATDMLNRTLGDVRIRFAQGIRRAVPRLHSDDLAWAMHFSAGVMAYHLCGGAMLRLMGGHHIDAQDQREAVERMVAYMAEGIRAMAAKAEHA